MARVVDITDKLSADENPVIVVRGEKLEVKADAETVIRIMGLVSDEGLEVSKVADILELIFTDEAKEKIGAMHLSFNNYQKLVSCAMDLIMAADDEMGE